MSASTLSKLISATTVVAFILYIVGFGSPYWLQKDFVLKVKGAVLGLPPPLDTMVIDLIIKSNMGLLKSCDDTLIMIPTKPRSQGDCGSDGAADWQKISAGLGIAALVLAFFSMVMSIVGMVVTKFQRSKVLKIAVAMVDFVIAGLMVSCLVIYVENKNIQVKPPLPDQINYDLYWAFYITVASAVLYALLTLFNVLDLIWNTSNSNVDISKEASVAYYNR